MSLKDWILLLVPILCNGVTIFVLQKMFEKKQIIMAIKMEYASVLRKKIDIALEQHAIATRLANEGNNENDTKINEAIQKYVNNSLDIYYYYIQNKDTFKSFDSNMNQLAELLKELTDCSHQPNIDLTEFSLIFNRIRDVLMSMKNDCIKLELL